MNVLCVSELKLQIEIIESLKICDNGCFIVLYYIILDTAHGLS
jgi:hypothetical protein